MRREYGEGEAEQAVSAAATCSLCELYTLGGRHSFVVRRAAHLPQIVR